jgi:DNA-binding transcriptional MerR regulator
MAHNKAIVSSANARILGTLISVLRFLAVMDEFSLQTNNLRSTLATTAVTGITAPRVRGVTAILVGNLIESLDETLTLDKNTLTLECVQGLILPMVQSSGSKDLRSGDLAKTAGVSPDTIRHYERIGVLPRASRTESGYRLYPASAVERVLVVQRALRIGFTLAELAEVLKARDAGGVPCRRVYQLAQEKLKGIEADIEALKLTRRYVRKVLADWEQRAQNAGPGQQSHLLYSLGDAVKNAGIPADRFRRKNRQ